MGQRVLGCRQKQQRCLSIRDIFGKGCLAGFIYMKLFSNAVMKRGCPNTGS